jgi:hypothetical protein
MNTWKRTKGTEGITRSSLSTWVHPRFFVGFVFVSVIRFLCNTGILFDLLVFFIWSLYYFYSHLLLLITPSVPFGLFHVVIVLFLLTFTASDYPFGTFCPFSCSHCIIFIHIYCFWLPLRYLLSFFMWSLYYFYSHLLLLITPLVPFGLFHMVIVLFLLTFTASDYPFGTFWLFSCGYCIIFTHIYCFWLPLLYLLSFFWPHEKDQKVPKG